MITKGKLLFFISLVLLASCRKKKIRQNSNTITQKEISKEDIGLKTLEGFFESRCPHCHEISDQPVGGGAGYINDAPPPDFYIPSGISDLDFKNTIESASSGQVIFLDGNLVLDLTHLLANTGQKSIYVPSGVTIMSDRGTNGSLGAYIKTDAWRSYGSSGGNSDGFLGQNDPYNNPYALFVIEFNDVRISGIRFVGPTQLAGNPQDGPLGNYGVKDKQCIQINRTADDVEIDNCVFYAFPHAAISTGWNQGSGVSENIRIHNNQFYNNRQKGLGYAVSVDYSFPKIYENVFKGNRHDIAGTGNDDCSYEAYCNVILEGGIGHSFDMHGANNDKGPAAGKFIYIHHNDFRDLGFSRYQSSNEINILIRGRPSIQCRIENNVFSHDGPQAAVRQDDDPSSQRGNFLVWNNIYESDEYLGWYVKETWLPTATSNFINLPSSNDQILCGTHPGEVYNFAYNFGDYDGDGKTDIFKLENNKLFVLPYDAGNTGINTTWSYINYTSHPMSDLRFGFFNGDNLTDMIVKGSPNILNASWGANSSWSSPLNTGYQMSNFHLKDMDGNGITDLFLAAGGTWQASYNINSNWSYLNSSVYNTNEVKMGRFNANAKYDVFRGNGTSWLVSYEGTSSWTYLNSSGHFTGELDVEDFNGDNISDVFLPNMRDISISGTASWIDMNTNNFPLASFSFGNF